MLSRIPYRIAAEPWPASLGSHRTIVRVEAPAKVAHAHVVWRRRDLNPERKDIVVIDRATKQVVRNRAAQRITQESGDVFFQPTTAPSEYEIYYLPFDQAPQPGLNAGQYKRPEPGPDFPIVGAATASVLAIESRTAFDFATSMGLIAMQAEVNDLMARHSAEPYLLFAAPRELPIRMTDHLPVQWMDNGPSDAFHGQVSRNEYFAFQIGVFAARQKLESLSITFGDLKNGKAILPASTLRCFNLGGIDRHGKAFSKNVSVEKGKVQALWFGVDVPETARPGEYRGTVTIHVANAPSRSIELRLTIQENILTDRGDSEPWRHSRLRWLDSTIGSEDTVTPPFTPVKATGRTVRILDRVLTFGANGLPSQIESRKQPILHSPARFVVKANDKTIEFKRGAAKITSKSATHCDWETKSTQGVFKLGCRATMEFDGYVSYELSLRAERDIFVDDIALEVPFRREVATYLMGMCHRGGKRPTHFEWRWDWSKNQDNVWIGDANAGLRIQLRDDSYEKPLNVQYTKKPLKLPRSWHNEGFGGCLIRDIDDNCVLFKANCNSRQMKAGEELRFDFTLLITPFKPVDTGKHFHTRHFHSAAPVEKAVEQGLNNITIHHGTPPYPFINYPFATADKLRAHSDEVHRLGLKMRIYYTLRELTNHVTEIWALRSLGDEIFLKADGGGHAWLQENLIRDYTPNWYHPFENGDVDLAITEVASSRWHNYWLEGLRWLCENVDIDGIYIDDTNLDRITMRRARRILEKYRTGAIVDLHSNDMYWAFYGLAHTTNSYMELFPYIDSTWFGESYDYMRTSPAYWLTEFSGIPFGLMGEVMPYARVANPWRAALYGLHARLPVSDPIHDPSPIFRVWDEFGIADSKMIGYWEKNCPVRTNHPDVLATVYVHEGKTLIALASWAEKPVHVKLKIDWRALGLNSRRAKLRAPRIDCFQPASTLTPKDEIPVLSQQGRMFIVS